MFSERLESCRETQLPEHVGAKAAGVFLAVQFQLLLFTVVSDALPT